MVLMLMAVLAASPAGTTQGIGVLDFAAQGGASTELAAALSTLTSQELERLAVFRVSSSETMRVMLGVDRQRQLVGCDTCNATSLSDLANYDFVVTGKVLKSKTDYTLFMSLVPVGSSQALSSTKVSAATESALMQEVKPTVITLMSKVLEGKQGTLIVTTSEIGADVKVDERQIGTTPLEPIVIPAGPHLVTVTKDGFSQVRKEVRVNVDQVTDESIRLVPSPDTILSYEARAKRMRALAWTAVGVGIAGFGLAIVSEAQAARVYGSDVNSPNTFQYARNELIKGNEEFRAQANELKSQLQTWNALAIVGMSVGAAAAIASVVLFIVGEDPAKYEQFHRVKPESKQGAPTVSFSPTANGLGVSGTF